MFSNKSFATLVRIFLPLLMFVGGIFVFTSLTLSDTDDLKQQEHGLSHSKSKEEVKTKRFAKMEEENFLKNVNLLEPSFPDLIVNNSKKVNVEAKNELIMGVNMFYREASPPPDVTLSDQSVLLLHGASFKSQTWLDLGTLNLLSAMGHHVLAVDLPGYGETTAQFSGNKADFLKKIISTLQLRNVVIVSPSMSGGYSIPFLINYSQDLDGYVPVAPVSTNDVVNAAPKILTPTLIIYGELDTGLGASSLKDLSNLPVSQSVELPNAKHPAYLSQPKMFHTLLYNFMNLLKKHKSLTP